MAAFLDNSNDIILDAVLTDYGRQLLAKGDGSFNVVKFAFGDDEIDYSLYQATASTPNQDTDIMSTVILEAFTNNAASMKSKLLTIPDNSLLFLPVLKLNVSTKTAPVTTGFFGSEDYFVIPVDSSRAVRASTNALSASNNNEFAAGIVKFDMGIVVDQGLDSSKTDNQKTLKNSPLYETEYNIMIDSRLGIIKSIGSTDTIGNPISIDDDLMATYKIVDSATGTSNFMQIPVNATEATPIAGTKGSRIMFSVLPAVNLENTDTFFDRLGSVSSGLNTAQPTKTFKIIRSSIRVQGMTTGYSIDIPIVFAKLQS